MNMPMVSVIILSYRNMAGIYESLESVFQQTYSNIELIISDDGSPEFVEEQKKIENYIKENRKDNIHSVLFHAISENGGTVKNVNSSIRLSKGQYIKFLSAEDRFADENSLSEFVSQIEDSKRLIMFAKVRGVTTDGKYIYKLASCDDNYEVLKKLTPIEILNRLYNRNFLPGIAWIAKRQLFEQEGFFDENMRLIEDYPYWIRLARNNVMFGYINKVLIDYRMSGVSSKGVYSEMFMKDMFTVYDQYIFPYDHRYGKLQGIYNFLKRRGLNYYMGKARWNGYTLMQKLAFWVLYFPFDIYVKIQNLSVKYANRFQ